MGKPSSSAPGVSIADATADENTGSITLTITKARAKSYSQVSVNTIDGTAIAGTDYTPINQTLTLANTATSKQITIPLINTSAPGPSKTFQVALTAIRNATIVRSPATATITNSNVAPPAPSPPPPGGYTLGINEIEWNYWTNSCPANNLIRGEINQYRADPNSGLILPLSDTYVDSARWPKALPNVGAYIVRILSNPMATGTLSVSWTGNATDMFVTGPATLTGFNNTTKTATITVSDVIPSAQNPIIFYYTFTDTVNYPVIDIRVSGTAGTFTPRHLTDLERFTGTQRVVKWKQNVEANNGNQTAWAGGTQNAPNTLIKWANRNSYTGGDWVSYDGVPIEAIIERANTTNRSVRYPFEWNCDDAYITNVCAYAASNLNSGLKFEVANSNEVWNPAYNVFFQAANEGQAAGLPDGGHGGGYGWALYRYAQRTAHVHSLAKAAFSGAPSKLLTVFEWQHANSWGISEVFAWMQANHSDWLANIDAMATAPYFSVDGFAWSYTGDMQAVFDAIKVYIDGFLTPNANTHRTTATTYGKLLTTYEGGASLLFTDPTYQRAIHTDSRMYDTYIYYLSWLKSHFDSAILFAMTHPITATNAWGLKEYESQTISKATTPKFQAVIDSLA